MAATIRDVALRAGVSISTVSRVLNNTCPVKEGKRRRVEEAVQALGYTPNQVARSLLKKETGGLGVLLPYVSGEFFSEFLNGIDEATQEHGFFLMISTSHRSPEAMKAALGGMHQRVDGLLIMAPEGDAKKLTALIPEEAPVVFVNTDGTGLPYETLNFDNYGGARLATEHLIALGHRRIAMLTGPAQAYDARERRAGYHDALKAHGIAPDGELELAGDYSLEAGYSAAAALANLDPRPSAIFCANDQSAISLVGALGNTGLKVPETVSVVGFDDIPSARHTTPPLTTVRVPIRELGKEAIRRLIQRIHQDEIDRPQRLLPVELVVRHSTAPYTNLDA